MTMTPPIPDSLAAATALRRDWLAVLVRAPRAELAERAQRVFEGATFTVMREPEIGLTMVQGRVGNTGERFNVGEATVTRCVVRHAAADGQAAAGVGYVLGRDVERARWVAQADALLQQPAHRAAVLAELVEPLRGSIRASDADEAARTAASRVRFFTLDAKAMA